MNYNEILVKLDKLRAGYKSSGAEREETKILYGELEEVINRFAGVENVEVKTHGNLGLCETYPNKVAAGLLASRTFFQNAGFSQLLAVIGKVRQHANDPNIPQVEYSVTDLVRSLRRFRECCQYEPDKPKCEKDVQNILWIMLRAQYDRLDRESVLPAFGVKSYRPDFGLPDLRVLLEVKYIGDRTNPADIQEEILADVPGYLSESTKYDSLIVFIFDGAHKIPDSRKLEEDLRSLDKIVDVIVTHGF